MDNGIGPTLREARKRRGVDLAAVEAATKIRLRYLRAIENEEWDALPGGTYTRAFIRTYAAHLGLDGERLADEFRREVPSEGRSEPPAAEAAPAPRLGAGPAPISLPGIPGGRLRLRSWMALAALGAIAFLIAIGLAVGGGGSSSPSRARHRDQKSAQKVRVQRASQRGVALRLQAEAEIWVCLLDAAGKPLINGQILEGGVEEGPFHSGGYTVTLGNGEMTMLIDGRRIRIQPSAEPVGYRISARGELAPLEEAERPTCT